MPILFSEIFRGKKSEKILTDRNADFTPSRFRKVLLHNNLKGLFTTVHHPQTSGKVERSSQTIVTRLKCVVNSSLNKMP